MQWRLRLHEVYHRMQLFVNTIVKKTRWGNRIQAMRIQQATRTGS